MISVHLQRRWSQRLQNGSQHHQKGLNHSLQNGSQPAKLRGLNTLGQNRVLQHAGKMSVSTFKAGLIITKGAALTSWNNPKTASQTSRDADHGYSSTLTGKVLLQWASQNWVSVSACKTECSRTCMVTGLNTWQNGRSDATFHKLGPHHHDQNDSVNNPENWAHDLPVKRCLNTSKTGLNTFRVRVKNTSKTGSQHLQNGSLNTCKTGLNTWAENGSSHFPP